jgi:hypothetical protein
MPWYHPVAMDTGFAVGDLVVFLPDAETIRRYGAAFARLRIYPGYMGPVVRVTSGLVRVGDTLKSWPATQFQRADRFDPSEIAAQRIAGERSLYAGRGPLPFHLGDRVRFRPSDLCDLLHGDEFRAAGLYPTQVACITSIRDDDLVEIDGIGLFYHWSEFQSAL